MRRDYEIYRGRRDDEEEGVPAQFTFSLSAMPFRALVGGAASSFGPLTLLFGTSPLRTRLATLDWYSSRVMRVPKKRLNRSVFCQRRCAREEGTKNDHLLPRDEPRLRVVLLQPGDLVCGKPAG